MSLFRAPWARRSMLVALARVANFLFFLVTALYCLLTYSSFAYQQFIRPHLVSWLTGFVSWQHLAFWLMLIVTAWSLLPELSGGRGRLLARGYLAASTFIGVMLLVWPVLPQVENNGRGLLLALVALMLPSWLALVDHVRSRPAATLALSSDGRIRNAALLACAAVWASQVVMIPARLDQTGEIRLSWGAIWFGVATSAVGHLVAFSLLAFVVVGALQVGRRWHAASAAQYWLLAVLAAAALALMVDRLVFAAIAFAGLQAWLVSIALALATVLVWSGVAGLLHDRGEAGVSVIEAWLEPIPGARSRRVSAVALPAVVFAHVGLLSYVATFDWDFLLQKLCVLAIWFLAFAFAFGSLPAGRPVLRWGAIAGPLLASVVLFGGSAYARERISTWTGDRTFVPEFVLEGYIAVDPSYRVIHDALRVKSREEADFYAHLRASSLIQHVTVRPIDVDFARFQTHGAPEHAGASKPNFFLFVIDSLRRDYLSPYNPAVGFTPAIGNFARDSIVFERAYTRYGGTGLAVPAIWAGGMLLHKQYVTPFDRMNALQKLLQKDHYRRLIGMDSIVAQLMAPPPDDELDPGVPIVSDRLCGTLEDLKRKLTAGSPEDAGPSRPVFAYSLPQDIHISHIRSRPVPPGANYPGFFAPVAAQVEEMDRCFGDFITFLKHEHLYDDSVIVITADHGDSLGEGLRWGHSYTMFPEVSRIPLIAHVPERFRRGLVFDPDAVALSTDLTPTFYVLAGHEAKDLGPLYGRPLFAHSGSELMLRRQEPALLASSYGAVYAVLHDNGTRLYIADAVNKRDYSYEIGAGHTRRIGVTVEERQADRAFIRRWVDEIAALYHFDPQ